MTCGPTNLMGTEGFVNLVNMNDSSSSAQEVADVHQTAAVLLQSLIFLLQPPKPAPAGLPAPSSRGRLCCRQAIPLSTHTSCYFLGRQPHPAADQSVLVLPSAWASAAVASSASGGSLPGPRPHPPHLCSRRGEVNMVNKQQPSEEYCTWRG